jgi:hypothetical protein
MPCRWPPTRRERSPAAQKNALELSIAFRITRRTNCAWWVTHEYIALHRFAGFPINVGPIPSCANVVGRQLGTCALSGFLTSRNSGQTKFRCADKWCCRQNGQLPRDWLQVVRWSTLRTRREPVDDNDQFLCSHGMQIGTSRDSCAAVAIERETEPIRTPLFA